MARKSNTRGSISQRANKNQRSESRRKESSRMVIEGLCKGINDFAHKRSKLFTDLQSDGKESKHRKDEFDGIGNEISEEKRLKNLEEDRGKIYGDPFLSHQAIGLVWEGIFRNRYHCFSSYSEHMTTIGEVNPKENRYYSPSMMPGQLFPADLVAEMMAGLKLCRLSRPIYKQDSADDLHVFVSLSERFRGGKK